MPLLAGSDCKMKLTVIQENLWKQKNDVFSIRSLIELLLLTMLPICIGFLLKPDDPFFLQHRFPILLIPSLLLALRYGMISGMASFSLSLATITGAYILGIGGMHDFPGETLFGILVFTLITGEMTNRSLAEIRRSQSENKFLKMRFGEFTNAYHVMKVSHDQLKEQLANSKFSLREALQMVREKLMQNDQQDQQGLNAQAGHELLSIFNYFCATQVAGVYVVNESGMVAKHPVAVQGNMKALDENDQLILHALEQGVMVSICSETYANKSIEELKTDLLAVIPIKDVSGHLWGIVAVAEMHFTAFQDGNLNLMQLIGSYTGDLLSQAENNFYAEGGRQAFLGELKSSWHLAKDFGVISSIVRIVFQKSIPADDYVSAIVQRIRSLDHAWIFSDEKKHRVICLLMPLITENEYHNFRNSLESFLRDRFGQTVEDAGGAFQYMEIRGKRRLYDYVSFITDRVRYTADRIPAEAAAAAQNADITAPDLKEKVNAAALSQKPTVTILDLEKKMEKIMLIRDHEGVELINIPEAFLQNGAEFRNER